MLFVERDFERMEKISGRAAERSNNQNEIDDSDECLCGGTLVSGFSTEAGGDIQICKSCGREYREH